MEINITVLISIQFSWSKTVIVQLSAMSVRKWAVWTYLPTAIFILVMHLHLRTTYLHPWLLTYKNITKQNSLKVIDYSYLWYSTRQDLAWSPSPRLTVILNFFHFLIIELEGSCCLLTKLFAYCPVAHLSLVQVYNFVPSVLRQLFGLARSGEVGVWLSVWTGVFYTGNEFKQLQLIQVMCGG